MLGKDSFLRVENNSAIHNCEVDISSVIFHAESMCCGTLPFLWFPHDNVVVTFPGGGKLISIIAVITGCIGCKHL